MHLEGPDSQATTEAAEQMSMDWIRSQQLRKRYYARCFQFRFCASDPRRNSTSAMLTAFFLHFLRTKSDTWYLLEQQNQLRDQHRLQNSWTDDDLCNMALNSYSWMWEQPTLILLGLDEWDAASRRRFWTLVGGIASRCEMPIKIIVAGSKPGSYDAEMLRGELKYWPAVNIVQTKVPQEPEIDGGSSTRKKDWLARLGWPWAGNDPVKEALERLQPMNPNTLSSILDVITLYSRWPAERTKENLNVFLDTIKQVDSSNTPEETTWKILSSTTGQNSIMNALMWIVAAQRPFTLWELASFVVISRNIHSGQPGPPDSEGIRRCSMELDKQIRGFAVIEAGQFRIHSHILELVADTPTENWEELRNRAAQLTAEVLLQYLKMSAIQERLHALSKRYEERLQQSGDAMTPQIVSDGKDVLFYAVEALPHHLSAIEVPQDIENQLRDPLGPYEAWSKVYWAMSNPFARPSFGPLESAWSTWKPNFDGQGNNERPPMDSLAEAVRANNQDLALNYAKEVISNFQHQSPLTKNESLSFPPSILWRATWLDMDRLLDFVLSHSEQQNDNSSAFCPSMLFLASRIGCSNSVDVLLKHEADTRLDMNDGRTALFSACCRGHVTIVRTLVKKQPNQIASLQQYTPLYAASSWGCWETVETLLNSGAEPNETGNALKSRVADDPLDHGWMPITKASSGGFVKTVRILLKHGANPETPGPWGADTCLFMATEHSMSLETMKVLLEHGADPNHKNLEDPLLSLIIRNTRISDTTKLEMFALLLDTDPPINLDRANGGGATPLMIAAVTGNLSATQWLLEKGANINAHDSENHTALSLAIIEGRWEVVHSLLNHRVKPILDLVSIDGFTLLHAAMKNVDELRNLLEAGADPGFVNHWQERLLNSAVRFEKTEVVKMLLESGRNADLHHRDSDGWTPIMVATGHAPNQEITRILMEAGSSLKETLPLGSSPLHLAAWQCRPDVLQVLLDFHENDDLSRKPAHGRTPLLAINDFANEGAIECIRLLVRAGADINSQDNDGETLLIQTAKAGSGARGIHQWLLARPTVDVHLESIRDGTALHLACKYGDEELVSMLLQKGANANSQHMCRESTPLIAACISMRRLELENVKTRMENAEKIVRTLVAKGADASLTSGISIFNALCAAAFCAGIGTINFILDKAGSAHTPDPLGRLPIHFAAVNGIRNFEAVALAHDQDIMIPDNFGKNALHWASQFGNSGVVRAIFQRLSQHERKKYANSEDADGWTPLAWASRPIAHDDKKFWGRSEPADYETTVQQLVEKGADISVRFHTGRGAEKEEFTPLSMARRYEADAAVIELLTPQRPDGQALSQSVEEPIYTKTDGYCGFCFVVSYLLYPLFPLVSTSSSCVLWYSAPKRSQDLLVINAC